MKATPKYIWTDASTDGGPNGRPMIGAVYITSQGQIESIGMELEQHTVDSLMSQSNGNTIQGKNKQEKKPIEIYEMMAARLAQEYWASSIRESVVNLGVDNTTQLFASIKISGKNQRVAEMAAAQAFRLYTLGITANWRYENTAWNMADYCTRVDILPKWEELTGQKIRMIQEDDDQYNPRKWTKLTATVNQVKHTAENEEARILDTEQWVMNMKQALRLTGVCNNTDVGGTEREEADTEDDESEIEFEEINEVEELRRVRK